VSKVVADQTGNPGAPQHAVAQGSGEPEDWSHLSIGDLLRNAARESGDKIALVDGVSDPALRRRWTFRELLAQSEQAARALLAQFQPGDRIALCSPNCPEWVILEYGVALAGMILVPVNPAYRAAEVTALLQDCEAHALFHATAWKNNDIDAMAAQVKAQSLPDLELFSLSDWDSFLARGNNALPLPDVDPKNPVLIQFTSGTTGRPKGAILHHGVLNPPRAVADCCGFGRHGVWLNAMPMFHIGGAVVALFAAHSQHGAFVQMREWDPALALDLIETERCTGMLLVVTMVVAMLDLPNFAEHDLSSVEFIVTGASPVPPTLLDRVTDRIGCRMLICFGLTETGGPVSNTAIGDGAHELANTLGRHLPNVEAQIRDPETGEVLPVGTSGEMWFRSSWIMLGYYGREAETRAAITPDGWLRSGDLGKMDERGYLYITGRLKDMIIRGGANIYPREVEDVLFEHPSVAQSAVIGFPDDKWGELVLAVVQPADGQELRFDELQQHCRERLASFKVPALWCSISDFPINPTGKIQKFTLADWVREGRLKPVSLR